jgi:serine/threonine-protein kinase RsbW
LAVDEASANAIIHGNNCNEELSIVVELYFQDAKLTVRIFDIGDFAFDEKLMDRNIETLLRERAKGGLGLRLIHALMDDVRFFHEGDTHVCTLTKYVA